MDNPQLTSDYRYCSSHMLPSLHRDTTRCTWSHDQFAACKPPIHTGPFCAMLTGVSYTTSNYNGWFITMNLWYWMIETYSVVPLWLQKPPHGSNSHHLSGTTNSPSPADPLEIMGPTYPWSLAKHCQSHDPNTTGYGINLPTFAYIQLPACIVNYAKHVVFETTANRMRLYSDDTNA